MIDIGATKTLIALFSRRGRVVQRCRFPTAQKMTTFFQDLDAHLTEFVKHKQKPAAVVVAVPGIVQADRTVRFGNRRWGDVDILRPVKKLFDAPLYLENDANLAALYEARGLPGRTVYLTFSTGIGGGVVEDDHLVVEDFEPGHRIYIYQGASAEWEDLAAASAIGKIYHVGHASELKERAALQDVAARLYLGLPDIVAEFHPDTIIFGGPLSKIFRRLNRYLPPISGVEYLPSQRPQESVIYGGYLYALEQQ